jgi:hypothetical protein
MSVLANIHISYESLPGEPSFFVTSQQALSKEQELPQSPFSTPHLLQSAPAKRKVSNFDLSNVSVHTYARVTPARKATVKPALHQSSMEFKPRTLHKPLTSFEAKPVQKVQPVNAIAQAVSNDKPANRSRGMFNDFERASLLSYMQTRAY